MMRYQFSHKLNLTLFSLVVAFFLSACSESNSAQQNAAPKVVLDQELMTIYNRSCKNCHEVPQTTSPQTGDVERWKTVLSKGMDVTMDRVMNGYQGMPPAGQCFECSLEQMEQLIYYMAQESVPQEKVPQEKSNAS